MKKVSLKVVSLLLSIVQATILFSGCSIFPEQEEPEMPELATPKPVEYSFYSVKKGTLQNTSTGSGKVTSIYYTEHSFKQSGGKFKEIHVSLGDYVRAGDPLFEIENTELETEYIDAEIEYEKKKIQHEENKRKYNNGSISQAEYHISELELKSAEIKYEDLKEAYDNTVLYAKVSGKVVYINSAYTAASETTEIAGGDTIIAIDSENPDYIFVTFEKTESHADYTPAQFKVGETLDLVQIDSNGSKLPGAETFKGTIVSTDAIKNSTDLEHISNINYYCKMENPPEEISIGSSVRYDYVEFSIEDCLIIPTSALYEFNGETFVYMLDSSTNLKKEVPVEIGYRTSSQAQVLDGLEVGDIIIEG